MHLGEVEERNMFKNPGLFEGQVDLHLPCDITPKKLNACLDCLFQGIGHRHVGMSPLC